MGATSSNIIQRLAVSAAIPAVGVILLVAALLKLHAMVLHGTGFADGIFKSTLVAAELVLGVLLLFAAPNRRIVEATAVLFTGFAAYSVYLIVIGRPTCNCFGVLSTRVWHSLGVDLLGLALLGSSLAFGRYHPWSMQSYRSAAWLSGCAVIIALGLGPLLAMADRRPEVAWLRGEALRIDSRSIDSVSALINEERAVTIRVTNRWSEPVKLVGGTFGCACNLTKDLPATLAAR